ncbi:uncharacterized protein BXZ73DRAFT_106788 [Epithele typhae]|uniref:uncharacterized protein n=1 Tax=Epithele typhae TaxID=378194 RepID=UPI0020086787|nr:uncharacterized protein BXZ73DRAFT_106788 [Epithele typhae]KAH9913884.1 hypothetical protein BXZ73DRAFT_106788 [Epithele typhae]
MAVWLWVYSSIHEDDHSASVHHCFFEARLQLTFNTGLKLVRAFPRVLKVPLESSAKEVLTFPATLTTNTPREDVHADVLNMEIGIWEPRRCTAALCFSLRTSARPSRRSPPPRRPPPPPAFASPSSSLPSSSSPCSAHPLAICAAALPTTFISPSSASFQPMSPPPCRLPPPRPRLVRPRLAHVLALPLCVTRRRLAFFRARLLHAHFLRARLAALPFSTHLAVRLRLTRVPHACATGSPSSALPFSAHIAIHLRLACVLPPACLLRARQARLRLAASPYSACASSSLASYMLALPASHTLTSPTPAYRLRARIANLPALPASIRVAPIRPCRPPAPTSASASTLLWGVVLLASPPV